jgi:hypothetical protein
MCYYAGQDLGAVQLGTSDLQCLMTLKGKLPTLQLSEGFSGAGGSNPKVAPYVAGGLILAPGRRF